MASIVSFGPEITEEHPKGRQPPRDRSRRLPLARLVLKVISQVDRFGTDKGLTQPDKEEVRILQVAAISVQRINRQPAPPKRGAPGTREAQAAGTAREDGRS